MMIQQKYASPTALMTLLVLVATFIASFYSLQVPDPKSDSPSTDSFSAQKAIQRLNAILPKNAQPHPVNSKANLVMRDNIINQFDIMGIQSELQNTMSCTNSRRSLRCSKVSNIISKIPGTDSTHTVMIMAHYDSVPAGPGAADAGHAVAIILELLDLLKNQPPFKNDLIVLINEGEEAGLLGVEAFMAEHRFAKDVDVVINLEARGNSGKSLLFETGEDNLGLIKLYQQYAKEPTSNSLIYEIYKLLPNDTDLTVTKRYGKTGVNFAFQGRVNHYHTPLDNLENLSLGSVQHQGDNAYAMLQPLLNIDLDTLPKGNAVYTDVLSNFMIVWPEHMTIPLTFIALMLVLLISWHLIKTNKINANQIAIALPFAFAVMILSAIGNWIILSITQHLSDQAQPWLTQPIPMRFAIWLFPVAIGVMFANKYKENLSVWGLVMSSAILLLAFSLATSLYMPGLSYLTLIPLLVFGILLSIAIISGQLNNAKLTAGIILCSTVCIALLVFPIMLLLEEALGFSVAPVFGLLESLVILTALPLIVFANGATLKQIIYSAVTFSFLGVLITTQQQSHNAELPQSLNFEYLQQGDKATVQALTRAKLSQRIIAESAFSNEMKIARPWSKAIYPSIEAESLKLAAPNLDILSTIKGDDGWHISLKFSSERSIDQYLLYANIDRRIQQVILEDKSYSLPSSNIVEDDTQYYLCSGIDCNGQVFTLVVSGNESFELGLVDYSFGLPASLGYLDQLRGESAQQIQTGDVTSVHTKHQIILLDTQ